MSIIVDVAVVLSSADADRTTENLDTRQKYDWSMKFDQSDSCTGCLGVLTLDIVVYLTLDWFVLDRYTRYIFGPYIVVIFALIGSLEKNYVEGATNSIFTIVLLSVACVAAVVKVVLLFWRHFKKPLNTMMIFPTSQVLVTDEIEIKSNSK